MDEWLGAELEVTGTVTKLAAETVEVIKAAETLNLWTAGDVPKKNSLDDAQAKEVWTVLTSAMEDTWKVDANLTKPLLPAKMESRQTRLKLWFWAWALELQDDTVEKTPSALSEGEKKLLASDLDAQGMDSLAHLAWLLLSRHTGRPATTAACAGARYGTPPGEMIGGVAHRKSKLRNYNEVLADAKISGDPKEHDEWIDLLIRRLDQTSHPFAPKASVLLLKAHQNARRYFNGSGELYVQYLAKLDSTYPDRGYPLGVEVDSKLANAVFMEIMGGRCTPAAPKGLYAPPTAGSLTGSSSGSSTLSSALGSSASHSSGGNSDQLRQLIDLVQGMGSKISSLDAKVETTASGISSLTAEVERSTRRLQSVEGRLEAQKGTKCNFCGVFGHKQDNCPTHSAKNVLK